MKPLIRFIPSNLIVLSLWSVVFSLWPAPRACAELQNGMAAEVVIGQPNFTSGTANNGGRSARTLNFAITPYVGGGRLFIADAANHRILIFNSIPRTNFPAADIVLGQPDFSTATANNGGRSASSLNSPVSVFFLMEEKFLSLSNQIIACWFGIKSPL